MSLDFIRQSVSRHVNADYRRSYDWMVRFRAASGISMPEPPNLDIYMREHSYGPTEIEMEEVNIGAVIRTLPRRAMPITSTFTLRDDRNETVGRWLDSIAKRMINPDGTQNTPFDRDYGWVLIMDRFRMVYKHESDIKFELADSYEVVFKQRGDIDESYAEKGFLTYPATFVQFRS